MVVQLLDFNILIRWVNIFTDPASIIVKGQAYYVDSEDIVIIDLYADVYVDVGDNVYY